MSIREMGPYVLLHKVAEDALSEIYRAGLKSGEDVERVVLLCVFKAQTGNVEWIAETASVGRRALKGLESSHLADIVDTGKIDGRAFLAYDYIPGVSLGRLMEQSRSEDVPMPLELAILITDRSAKGLLDAWQHESRMLHGFLVPPLMLVSNEGDVRLLGLEVASRLRRLLTDDGVRSELGAYLAPEIVPDGQPATTDDVYSLGATLFQMATGAVPPTNEAETEQALAAAILADGSELPEEIRDLLASSMAPPQHRLNLQDWSEKLSEIVLSGRYEATSFNLAFFLHRLFGDELEEQDDLVVAIPQATEEGMDADIEAPMEVPDHEVELHPDFDVSNESSDPEAVEDTAMVPGVLADGGSESPAKSRYFAIAAAIGVLVIAAAGAAYFAGDPGKTPERAAKLTPQTQKAAPLQPLGRPTARSEVADQTPAVPTPKQTASLEQDAADIDRRVDELVSKRSQAMKQSMRDEYQQEIDTLRAQLVEAQRQPKEPQSSVETPLAEAAFGAAEAVDPVGDGPAAVDEAADQLELAQAGFSRSVDESPSGAEGSVIDVELPALAEPAEMEPVATQGVASQPGETEEAEQADDPGAESPSTTSAEPRSGTAASSAGPQAPAGQDVAQSRGTQRGDLVEPGAGVTPPKLLEPVQPAYPLLARRLNKQALVSVRVLVDETGKVTDVEQLGEQAGYGFDEAAVKAARGMIWEPASKDGVPVKMWWTVRLAFKP